MDDPETAGYVRHVAGLMDDRKARLGELAAREVPAWALRSLRPVPNNPQAREDWTRRAADVCAYQESYSHHDPADPIGPEPGPEMPAKRTAWHAAFAAIRISGAADVSQLPVVDGDRGLVAVLQRRDVLRWIELHIQQGTHRYAH